MLIRAEKLSLSKFMTDFNQVVCLKILKYLVLYFAELSFPQIPYLKQLIGWSSQKVRKI